MHIKFSHFWISDFSNFNNHRSLIVYTIYATFYGNLMQLVDTYLSLV